MALWSINQCGSVLSPFPSPISDSALLELNDQAHTYAPLLMKPVSRPGTPTNVSGLQSSSSGAFTDGLLQLDTQFSSDLKPTTTQFQQQHQQTSYQQAQLPLLSFSNTSTSSTDTQHQLIPMFVPVPTGDIYFMEQFDILNDNNSSSPSYCDSVSSAHSSDEAPSLHGEENHVLDQFLGDLPPIAYDFGHNQLPQSTAFAGKEKAPTNSTPRRRTIAATKSKSTSKKASTSLAAKLGAGSKQQTTNNVTPTTSTPTRRAKKPQKRTGSRSPTVPVSSQAAQQAKALLLGEPPYMCPFGCNKEFKKKTHFQAHIRIHTGERPFVCKHPGCQASYTRSDELARHKRIHSGIKPHKCDLCQYSFARSDHLTTHRKTHFKQRKVVSNMVAGRRTNKAAASK